MNNKVFLLFLGLLMGGGFGWWLGSPITSPADTASPISTTTSNVPAGWREIKISDLGIKFIVRTNDQIIRLKYEDKFIGYRITDQFASIGGVTIDLIYDRIAEFYDRPEARTLETYNEEVEGFTVQENREVIIHGHAAIKQLYTADFKQKTAFGFETTKPINNLMRYVLEQSEDKFIILRTSGQFQKYLDIMAQSVEFFPPSTQSGNGLEISTGTELQPATLDIPEE